MSKNLYLYIIPIVKMSKNILIFFEKISHRMENFQKEVEPKPSSALGSPDYKSGIMTDYTILALSDYLQLNPLY